MAIPEAEAVFGEIDEDDGGFILFNEFCSYLSRMKAQAMSSTAGAVSGTGLVAPAEDVVVPRTYSSGSPGTPEVKRIVLPATPPAPPPPPAPPASGELDLGAKLMQLADMKEKGILTEEEFTAAKAKCIATHGI